MGQFFEFVHGIVDIGKLLQDCIPLCSEKSNLNAGWLFTLYFMIVTHTRHMSLVAFSYTLLQMWFFALFDFIYSFQSEVFSVMNNKTPIYWSLFSLFSPWTACWAFTSCTSLLFKWLESGIKVKFPLVGSLWLRKYPNCWLIN